MRKVIDAVTGGRIVVEDSTGQIVYHVETLDADGRAVADSATMDAAKAKRMWRKLREGRRGWKL